MEQRAKIYKALKDKTKFITINPLYFELGLSTTAVTILSYIIAWHDATGRDEIYKTANELNIEIFRNSQSLNKIYKAIKEIKQKCNFINFSTKGDCNKSHYKLNKEKLREFFNNCGIDFSKKSEKIKPKKEEKVAEKTEEILEKIKTNLAQNDELNLTNSLSNMPNPYTYNAKYTQNINMCVDNYSYSREEKIHTQEENINDLNNNYYQNKGVLIMLDNFKSSYEKKTKEFNKIEAFNKPTMSQAVEFAKSLGQDEVFGEKFFNYYESTEWARVANWQSKMRYWVANEYRFNKPKTAHKQTNSTQVIPTQREELKSPFDSNTTQFLMSDSVRDFLLRTNNQG